MYERRERGDWMWPSCVDPEIDFVRIEGSDLPDVAGEVAWAGWHEESHGRVPETSGRTIASRWTG